ncbi:MAG: hypothetical protein A2504_09625 [Bdellovibrionales bacterium RIFOXYD12_FULL_39_22]|nr:MAG: hypothetical protein A2385_13115 [Bdellovibrionales bacterium RIFOXYB1_FULL_39_21]OFZ40986.1 MAG: hypothetical protein A2485_16625 [Bdellovibrionales bacterium RIFOXYC12_FULL_39_17]OFZ44814.1 MAG: hypothetical protein A2404_09915 [Bdellovibrionales bacterium RIFOXYC1_FULL_39_130]OFZ74093.1 MAG: hypothetical protein A2451_14565 [Bdellovibrionales bacterium RIFOXYC2_FULL_39_8]OFZ74279.1 MAG: hypothetical protein A2560_16880 [Bdellovibrionales bacterium RIFOXYD1_FULL_39_84]OFZ92143.1 MAG:
MPTVERTEIYNTTPELFYKVITDYNSYPEFVDGVSEIKILSQKGDSLEVQFDLNLIKTFSYILQMKQTPNKKVEWSLKSGDIFKHNNGSWKLKDLGNGKTEVTYSIDVDFKGFVPKMLVNKLVSSNLPSMMQSYFKRAGK